MEIKKADSKGRVSGFEPGKYYSVVRGSTETGFSLNQLHEGGYTGTRNEPHGIVHEAVYYLHPGEDILKPLGTAEEAEMLLNQAMAKKNGMVN